MATELTATTAPADADRATAQATARAQVQTETQAQPVPLRRNRRFQMLWGGAASAMLGTCLADTAYPLLLLAMTGSPALAGAFGAVQFAASALFGLHGGSPTAATGAGSCWPPTPSACSPPSAWSPPCGCTA